MIVIIISYNAFKVVSAFFDELQAVNHTSIVSECILLALDGLELTGIQVAAAVCIVPCLFIIIIPYLHLLVVVVAKLAKKNDIQHTI